MKPAADKVEAFAGDTTGAEKKIKTAQFRQEALQNSKAIQWQTFAERNSATGGRADLSLLRSMQEFEEHGKRFGKELMKMVMKEHLHMIRMQNVSML